MRSLLALLACLMLVVTASGAAQAAGFGCSETVGAVAVHVAGNCDEVPADSDKNYPHCHTGCHGQHAAAPLPFRTAVPIADLTLDYAPAARVVLTASRVDPALRPPQA